MEFYITRWKKKYTEPRKIIQSLRAFHFGNDFVKAKDFYNSLDKTIYNANFKVWFGINKNRFFKSTQYCIRKGDK